MTMPRSSATAARRSSSRTPRWRGGCGRRWRGCRPRPPASPADPPRAVRSRDRLCARASPALEPEPVSGDDMAFWLYTSGTTGVPKGAIHLHRDHLACHHYAVDVLGVTAEDRVLATSRLFFAYALGNSFLLPLFAGACTFLNPAWPDPAAVAESMLRFEPTILFSVPTFYARMLRASPPPESFRSLRFAVSAGGGPPPPRPPPPPR